jgi:hypothetical protein
MPPVCRVPAALATGNVRPPESHCPSRSFRALWTMGAKYLPTIKDQQASQRFQQKQNPLRKFKPQPAKGSARKGRGK